ncbi:hypothetical protein [Rhodococcus sp. T2V]|uniref:hypothetical protein n=1 Tax=Rhodococcus sp. T2V TaxID=3034164 RepID=UPI0023E22DDE|nr:hypothetical protein [Rhodococcus sp. T2V]MDF3307638.1 hypothetical protein [Rhodococcus sp. T2V]
MSLSDQLFIATSSSGVRVFPRILSIPRAEWRSLGSKVPLCAGEVPDRWIPGVCAVRFVEKAVEVQI